MEEIEKLLKNILSKMTEIAASLNDISGKLENVNGIHSLDDVVERLDDAIGLGGGNLSDVEVHLTNITSELSEINSTLMTKD